MVSYTNQEIENVDLFPMELDSPIPTPVSVMDQDKPHPSRSDRYSFISTKRIVDDLNTLGYELFDTQIARVRDEAKEGYQKHILRFRKSGFEYTGQKSVQEIVMVNSHGSQACALTFYIGETVFACLNGIISGHRFQSQKIRHTGYTEHKVENAISGLLEQSQEFEYARWNMQNKLLNGSQRRDFGWQALDILFDKGFNPNHYNRSASIENLLIPQRVEDKNFSLDSTFQIVQEKFIQGCGSHTPQKGFLVKTNFNRKNSNPIHAIDKKVRVNQELFDLAESFI